MADTFNRADVLAHYGVKGMKWGRRRRSDGTVEVTGRVAKGSEDHEKAAVLKKKRVAEMSNAELKQLNERMQLESNYSQLMGKQKGNTSPVAKGQKVVKTVLSTAQTANQVYTTINSPAVKEIRKLLNA